MSKTYSAKENKQQKQPKVQIEAYIYDINEPSSDTATIVPTDFMFGQLGTKIQRRSEFRRIVSTMKNRYA